MISIVRILLVIGLCFYIGILYSNPVIVTMGYTLGVLFLVSMIEIIYHMFTLSYHLEIPISMTESGRPVQIMIRLKNKSLLPVGKVEVRIENKNIFQRNTKKQWIPIYDVFRGQCKHSLTMMLEGAGCHEILLSKVRIYSLFGLIYLERKCKDFGAVLIMPEVNATNIQVTESVYNFLGDADVYDDFRPGHDSGETFEIRQYREKDKLQSIHWKLSAKMDELMVKENSFPKACAIVLMLELKPRKKNRGKKKEVDIGAYLELIASISFSLMDQKCPHFVTWYSRQKEGVCRIRVDDEESFYLFLNAYLRDAAPVDISLREEYRKAYRSEWYLYDLLVNEKFELYKNGELLTKLDEKKIKDECEKLEILL